MVAAGDGKGREWTRRDLLRIGGAAAVGLLGWPRRTLAALQGARSLSFYAVNTGERLSVDYFARGRYQPDGLQAIDHVLRDHRTDLVYPIDWRLLDILSALRDALDTRAPFHVVSGYRSRETNEARRRVSHGVAEHSYHVTGQAMDFFLPGRDLSEVRLAARGLAAGGVGYYPRSGFVHVDSGPVRAWGGGWRRRRQRPQRS